MKKYVKKLMAMLMVMLLVVTMAAPATVSAAPVRLNKSSVTVLVGKTYQLKVKGTKKKAKWSSSNKKVATVNSKGVITGKKAGTVKVTAKIGKKKYTCKVKIKANKWTTSVKYQQRNTWDNIAYCNNSPILFVDHDGDDAEAVGWWASTMWWLCAADGPIPVGDALYGLGIIVFGGISIYTASNFSFEVDLPKEHSSPCEAEEETEVPEVTYPGDDPAEAPDGTSWRGSGPQGSKEGNYYNQETGESWHPDLDHPDPIGPHWDYRDRAGAWWRIGKGNIITPK